MTGEAVKFQTKILKMMTHFILTNKGVSEECWQYSQEFKIFGSGQGTGWSPMVWNSTNDVISICLKENQDKMAFSSPTRKIISERSNDSFVDDMAIGLTAQPLESPEGITTRMNVLANKYDKYLNMSGGRLAVHKCLWYFFRIQEKRGQNISGNYQREPAPTGQYYRSFLRKKR